MDSNFNAPSETKTRPQFLTVICILSFIGSGFGIFGNLIALAASGVAATSAMLAAFAAGGITYSIIGLVLACGSLYGVIQMWGLKKMGFYIYTACNLIALIIPFFFIPAFGIGSFIFGLLIAGAFIAMYYVNLKSME